MITRKKVLIVAICLAVLLLLPFISILSQLYRWLVFIITYVCFGLFFAICLKYYHIIIGAYRIIVRSICNRILGYHSDDKVYPLITSEQKAQLNNAIKITFTGDLILLREMIERAFNRASGQYEFDGMFEYVSDIWKDSDLAIGVFEGPMCGEEYGYSTSNYDDNVPLALNFPDSFALAIKKAGIDLVSLANNHIFDMGIDGGLRTTRVLNRIGLDYAGLSTDKESYFKPKIINLNGKRIGVLAYTYGQNGKSDDSFFNKDTPNYYLKPVLSVNSKYFKRNIRLVKADFDALKRENPDLIIVLPHMGEQFRSNPDKTQRRWCKIFADLGADIIFADHPHHVQPIEWITNKKGKRVLTVYCPGNFINSYVDHDGDASMIVSAFLDKITLKPFAVSITPIYSYCKQNGAWTGLPTYMALTNKHIYDSLSRADFRRINSVNRLVTGIAIGAPLDVDAVQREYVYFADVGFVRSPPQKNDIPDIQQFNSVLLQEIKKSESICFIGDSVTDGTKNGGFGWYEPLIAIFPDKIITRFAEGSKTSRWLLENALKIANISAELYVVAIGCNDIRYRNPKICSMSAEDYIVALNSLVKTIKSHNQNSRFVFIAPWRSLHFDANFNIISQSERMDLYAAYTERLLIYCREEGHIFLDPNPLIFQNMESATIRTSDGVDILKDYIHPNAYSGIASYCNAAVRCK